MPAAVATPSSTTLPTETRRRAARAAAAASSATRMPPSFEMPTLTQLAAPLVATVCTCSTRADPFVGDDVDLMVLGVGRGDLRLAPVVARAHGLLDDLHAELAQDRAGGERLERGPQAVDVEQERMGLADAAPDGLDPSQVLAQRAGPGIQLQPLELRGLRLGRVRHALGIGVPADRAVELDRVPVPAAEQLVYGHAERLAGQVQQRHVDGRLRERGLKQPLAHPREQRPPVPRVLSDELRRDALLHERHHRLLRLSRQLRHRTGLAPADQPVLRRDPEQHIGGGRAHDATEPERHAQPRGERHGLDTGDLQR